jgi:hypothetical protein
MMGKDKEKKRLQNMTKLRQKRTRLFDMILKGEHLTELKNLYRKGHHDMKACVHRRTLKFRETQFTN